MGVQHDSTNARTALALLAAFVLPQISTLNGFIFARMKAVHHYWRNWHPSIDVLHAHELETLWNRGDANGLLAHTRKLGNIYGVEEHDSHKRALADDDQQYNDDFLRRRNEILEDVRATAGVVSLAIIISLVFLVLTEVLAAKKELAISAMTVASVWAALAVGWLARMVIEALKRF